jgi:hypothetical protein
MYRGSALFAIDRGENEAWAGYRYGVLLVRPDSRMIPYLT